MTKVNVILLCATFCLLLFNPLNGAPAEDTSLVISTEPSEASITQEKSDKDESQSPTLKIYQLKVDTNVSNRYAKTLITSKVRNLKQQAQEAVFSVVIPDQAFISGFTMEIDGKSYEAYVQEKEKAKDTYDKAVASGQSAGHVAVSARDSNRFTVSVNVEPQSKATFYLKYEELLARKNEKYEVVLNIHPGQPVKDLEVTVNIYESRPLKFVDTPALRSGNEISKNDTILQPEATITKINDTASTVTFNPNVDKQRELAKGLGVRDDSEGLSGQFVVQYDVERDPQGGEVLVDGGYFVHFFSPEGLPALPKQVVFVLDTSGSMSGTRISQLQQAMNSILGELKPEDVFSIVEFNSIVKVWNIERAKVQYEEGDDPFSSPGYATETSIKKEQVIPPSFQATPENVNKAKDVIKQLNAFGGTDIQSALEVGLRIVKRNANPKAHQPIIIFLTDGEPTVGAYDTKEITSKITELNTMKTPIFSLSIGDGADRDFLEKLSLKNQGFARHIYEAADAYLQLEDFYRQISSPLLTNVVFKYVDGTSKNVTKKEFPILFRGGELVTCGVIDPGFYPPSVEGWGKNGLISLKPTQHQAVGSLERLWAFQTIKHILKQRDLSDDKERYTQEALKLALKYSFVTDVSSLVVVKPNATSAVETEDGSKTQPDYYRGGPSSFPAATGFAGGYPIQPLGQSAFYASAAHVPVGRVSSLHTPFRNQYKSSFYGFGPRGFHRASYAAGSSGYRPLGLAGPQYSFAPMPPIQPSNVVAKDDVDETILSTMLLYSTTSIPKTTSVKASLPVSSEISWLNEEVTGENNDEIVLEQGQYKLGLNETITEKPECQNAPNNTTGFCSLVLSCPEIYPQLTDVKAFSTYFCELQGFAGVCCPSKKSR